MWVEEGFIKEIYEYMKQVDKPYVGLNVSMSKEGEIKTIAGKYNYLTGFPIERYINESNYANTGNLVVERKLFDKVGQFDENMISGGDKEFGKRVANAGYEQAYCDVITVYHPVRDSITEMLQKAVRIGRGKIQFAHLHPELNDGSDLTDPRVYLPPHPVRMKKLADGRSDITLSGFLLIYSFGVVYKYVRLYGMLLETLKNQH
jgi:GT2 family glycosyltransferase